MGKFGSQFFEKSPIKEVAKGRAGRLRKRAQRRSEKSGETGGYDYSDMKVLKLLGKAKRIENKNFIKDTGAKKGSKRKGSMYGEDARVSASYDRPDSDSNSPLEGAYASGAGGKVYVSNRQDFQKLQDRITGATVMAIAGERDPKTRSERLEKRIERRDKRAGRKGELIQNKDIELSKPIGNTLGDASNFGDEFSFMGGLAPFSIPSEKITTIENRQINPKRKKFEEKTQELRRRKQGFDDKVEKAKNERLDLLREAQALKNEKKVYNLEEIQGIVKRISDDFKKANNGKEIPGDELEKIQNKLILENTGIKNQ